MNPNLEKLANETKNPDLEDRDKRFIGYTYVPSLNLYVRDQILLMPGVSLYDCKKSMSTNEAIMLTPAQFWKYYDFCVEHNTIVGKFSEDRVEWLDAIVNRESWLVVRPQSKRDMPDLELYPDIKIGTGGFNRSDVDEKTGMTTEIRGGKDFPLLYNVRDGHPLGVSMIHGKILITTSRYFVDNSYCVRPCHTPEKMVEIFAESKAF